jgi:predicted nucleotidyltransferase
MKGDRMQLQHVTPAVQGKLDELVKALEKALAKNLVGVVVHGSAVRGGWRAGASDVDVVVVLGEGTQEALESIGPALELARFSARIEAMIVTKDEIPRSADCFPLLYSDLARTSATMYGENPFKALTVPDHHKRLRIEQELRELRIRMRRVATDNAGHHSYAGAVDRKLKQARDPLWSLLTLRGETLDDTLDVVLERCGKIYEIDLAPLRRVREEPKVAFDTLGKLLDKALDDVDSRDGQSGVTS